MKSQPPQLRRVRHPDLHEVAIFAVNVMQLLHLRKLGEAESRFKATDPLVRPHQDEGGQAQADRAGVDPGLPLDDTQLLQLAQPLEDGRGQPNASSDLRLEYGEDLQVDGVERRRGSLRHPADSFRAPRASTRPWTSRSAWKPSGSRFALSSVTTTPAHVGAVTKTLSAAKVDWGSSPPPLVDETGEPAMAGSLRS